MTAYFLLLFVPSILSLGGARKPRSISLFLAFLLFALFIGFRDRVGMDWPNYAQIHYLMNFTSLDAVFSEPEPLSHALFWVSEYLGAGMVLSNVVASLILLAGVFSFSRRTSDPWLALVAATPYLIIAFGMSAIRQSMAIGIFFWLLSRWDQSGAFKKTFFLFIASLFHTSAWILVPLVVLSLPLKMYLRTGLGIVGTLAGLYIAGRSGGYYDQAYVSGFTTGDGSQMKVDAPGAIFHVSLVLVPSITYLLNKRKLCSFVVERSAVELGALLSLCLFFLILYSSSGASRMSMYFIYVPMAVYPAITAALSPRDAPVAKFAIILFHFTVLATWLLFGNNAHAWVPFRSFLLQ
jgi:hypothetical protein